jgi:hypothetical protein
MKTETFNSLKSKLVLIIFKHSVRTSKKAQHVTITKIKKLMPFREIIAVYSENLMKPTNILCGPKVQLLIVGAGGTYSYHYALKS